MREVTLGTVLATLPLLLRAAPGEARERAVLVFTKTSGFRHESIPNGIDAVRKLGAEHRFAVEASEDAAVFEDVRLESFDAVVFLSTTGNIFDGGQKAAFQRFIQSGHGFVGVHSASDTEHDWSWYGRLVGAYFKSHPALAPASIMVSDGSHASTRELPARWNRTDEWYNFVSNPRGRVHVLATLDETTYVGGEMGSDHPIAWCQFYDGGRCWYTALGHTSEAYSEPLFLRHLLGGILFAAGYSDADCPGARVLAPRHTP